MELLEAFVAAPGPMGWRYFGRAREPDTGREVFLVDHVVDLDWNLVRFRWRVADRSDMVAVPAGDGIEVWIRDRKERFGGVAAVWSPSPSSLIVVDRLIRNSGAAEVRAVRFEPHSSPVPVVVRVTPVGFVEVPATSDPSDAAEVEVEVDGRRMAAVLRTDLPIKANGWFELMES
jgi:hypothetical protein